MAECVFAECVFLPVPLAVQPGSALLSLVPHENPVDLSETAAAPCGVLISTGFHTGSAVTTTNLLAECVRHHFYSYLSISFSATFVVSVEPNAD